MYTNILVRIQYAPTKKILRWWPGLRCDFRGLSEDGHVDAATWGARYPGAQRWFFSVDMGDLKIIQYVVGKIGKIWEKL
jgi:hypothetical protein